MKFGVRTPSLKRRLAARASLKRYVRHGLGLKAPRGYGFVTNPRKAFYNRTYNRTTISFDDLQRPRSTRTRRSARPIRPTLNPVNIDPGTVIRSSSNALAVTARDFASLREQVTATYQQRVEILGRLRLARLSYFFFTWLALLSYTCIIGLFWHQPRDWRMVRKQRVSQLKEQLDITYVTLTFADGSQLEKGWLNCVDAFQELMASDAKWDVTFSRRNDQVRERTIAAHSIERTAIKSSTKPIPIIHSDLEPLHLVNANGPDLYIYPTFALLFKDRKRFGIFNLVSIDIALETTRYLEESRLPRDVTIVGHTWKKANKDGSPDRRFASNYQIPLASYGQFTISSTDGLEERWMFSSASAFATFAAAFSAHLERVRAAASK